MSYSQLLCQWLVLIRCLVRDVGADCDVVVAVGQVRIMEFFAVELAVWWGGDLTLRHW